MPTVKRGESRAGYDLARYRRKMAAAIKALGGKCVQCGATEGLEFDHIDPATKLFTISRNWACEPVTFEAELKKCQLLCGPHHDLKTMREKGHSPAAGTHGTLSAYKYCKCAECRAAKAASNKAYKAKMKASRKSPWRT